MNSAADQLNEKLDTMLKELENLDTNYIDSLTSQNDLASYGEELNLTDYAQMNASLAFVANSLYFCFLKSNGMPITDHQINDELANTVIHKDPGTQKRNFSIDQNASNRMINNQINQNKPKNKGDMEMQDIWDEQQKDKNTNTTNAPRKLHKGALLPKTSHLSWQADLEQTLGQNK